MPKPTIQVTDFYNNGYNGGFTVRVTSKSKDLTFDVDGASIIVKNREMGRTLFQVTSWDDEFFSWDDESLADAISSGDLAPEEDKWGDHEVTAQGMERFNEDRISMLNDWVQADENYEGLHDLVLEMFNEMDAD